MDRTAFYINSSVYFVRKVALRISLAIIVGALRCSVPVNTNKDIVYHLDITKMGLRGGV